MSVSTPYLKQAIDEEIKFKKIYDSYSKKADTEKYINISHVFSAFEEGVSIVIRNHGRAMRDEKYETNKSKEIVINDSVGSTIENIERALLDIKAHIASYKQFIKEIKNNLNKNNYVIEDDAELFSLEWSIGLKKHHLKIIKLILKTLKKSEKFTHNNLEINNIYICKACGNPIFGNPERLCPLCLNPPLFFYQLKGKDNKNKLEEKK